MVKLLLSFKGILSINTGGTGGLEHASDTSVISLPKCSCAARASSLVTSGGFLNSEYLGITPTQCPAFREWSQVSFCRTEMWEE